MSVAAVATRSSTDRITAPLLWIEGDRSDVSVWWGNRYTKAEFHERLNVVADAQRYRRTGPCRRAAAATAAAEEGA